MSVYRRGDVWWYKFRFAGQMIRESSKSESRTVARDAERVRRRELEESWNQIKRRKLPPLFSLAAADWLKTRTSIAPSTERSYKLAISQLTKDFGKQLLCDLSGVDLATYQTRRKRDGVSNRTVNLELGVLRSILRRYRMWEPKDFEKGLIGFDKDIERELLGATSPFVFSVVRERSVLRLLKLIQCDNGKIGTYAKLVDDRNDSAHSNGNIFYSEPRALDIKISEILRVVDEIQTHSKPVVERCYQNFLLGNNNPEEREYPDARDHIREVLIHQNYLSQKDIEICLAYDLSHLRTGPDFPAIEVLHQSLRDAYADTEE